MNTWRRNIIKDFVPEINRLTIVSDPDSLLLEIELSAKIRKQGFDILEFTDSIEFRYIFETKYRSLWDKGLLTELVVALRSSDDDINSIPFDLLKQSRHLSYSLKEIFPKLSYPIIKQIDSIFYDDLFICHEYIKADRLSDNETKDFILNNIFKFYPESIQRDYELLHFLLHLHYNPVCMPTFVIDRLEQLFSKKNEFSNWPISDLISDSRFFFSFLQERWEYFLSKKANNYIASEPISPYKLKHPGPVDIPFDHDSVKVFIDNLFIEGFLFPIPFDGQFDQNLSWVKTGIAIDLDDKKLLKINLLKEQVESYIGKEDLRFQDWVNISLKLSECLSLSIFSANSDKENIIKRISEFDRYFEKWLLTYFSSLSNISTGDPVMVHHVLHKMLRDYEETNSPQALIVCDGLSLNQWYTVKEILKDQLPLIQFNETSLFSWIPTLTTVSRQAIFSGKIPLLFKNTISTTNNEEKYWRQFWLKNELNDNNILFFKDLGNTDFPSKIDELIILNKTKSIGIVLNIVDQIMHGMQLGLSGMHNQIKVWMESGHFAKLISNLQTKGFKIWITSDHGNKECIGKTPLKEGSLSISKGERVRIYDNETLRTRYSEQIDFGLNWPGYGLPNDFYALIARSNFSFSNPGVCSVTHGGISIEEVMVPFIELKRK